MLDRLFKKTLSAKVESHPALNRLRQMGAYSALCTMVRTADGKETQNEVGPVSFYRRGNRLFTRDSALYLVPPSRQLDELPFSGRGEVLNLKFQHKRTPYSLECEVVQRVRFSERLLGGGLEPRVPVGYKLSPVGDVNKNESRRTLRFAHIRGVKGPQVFPHLRFDLFVERVQYNGLAHEQPPEVVPFPGDDPIPEAVRGCDSPEELVAFFHTILRMNPEHLRQVHLTRVVREARTSVTELQDLGSTGVLGLKGDQAGTQIHLRTPRPHRATRTERRTTDRLKEGDVLILRFVGRGLLQGSDVYYQWSCRVHRCGLETLTLRPKGIIQQQTGLSTVMRDFCVSGVGLQNSPLLETYLVGQESVPNDPKDLLNRLKGTGLMMHFYPRLYFPNDLEAYRPHLPATFSILGGIVRGRVDSGKDEGRIASLGVAFSHDPVDYNPQTFEVTAWEPLRGLRENLHFKEIHRALNSLQAYLER